MNRKQKIVHSRCASNIKCSTFPFMYGACYLLMCYVFGIFVKTDLSLSKHGDVAKDYIEKPLVREKTEK